MRRSRSYQLDVHDFFVIMLDRKQRDCFSHSCLFIKIWRHHEKSGDLLVSNQMAPIVFLWIVTVFIDFIGSHIATHYTDCLQQAKPP